MLRHKVVFAALLLLGLAACQPDEAEVPEGVEPAATPVVTSDSPEAITIGHIDSLESAVLGESRDLWIYIPESSKRPENRERVYPVVYLLDGNGHFHSVSGMIRQLSAVNGNTKLPEMIVVGIPNTDRMRDLTPTNAEGADTSGGSAEFLQFVETELIPYIEQTYPVTGYRTFIGHSLGGLTVIDALFTMPEMFQNYVAIDPSLWWDDQFMLKRSEAMLIELDLAGKALFVGVANTMRGRIGYEQVREDDDPSTVHVRSILEFSELAESGISEGLAFDWKYYDDDSHGSVPLISEYDALRFMFSWYALDGLSNDLLLDPSTSEEQLLEMIAAHFDNVSSHFGYRVLPPENYINFRALGFLANERPDAALAMLNLNQQNYPQSPDVYDALGDYYLEQENSEEALRNFTRAVDLGAPIEVQEKLTALLSDD
ncbi:MAG: hypothetical protein DHS20C12_16720 [Pseudohongiella sp.]|nr:MAG: hypothetical protein DHS20C12_16720 [Pseudohongiella sp.]